MKWIIILITILICSDAVAQKAKRDTIYYLLRITKTSSADCAWISGVEGPFKYYKFKCSLLSNNQSVFIYNLDDPGVLVKRLPARVLPSNKLVESINKDSGLTFHRNDVIFFIEPSLNGYIEHRVRLVNSIRHDPIVDSVTIKIDTNRK